MADGEVRESEDEIEASGDAVVIAEAIYAGLSKIAQSLDRIAKILSDEYEGDDPDKTSSYMDGSFK